MLNFAKNRFSGKINRDKTKGLFQQKTLEELYGAYNNIEGQVPYG